MPLPEADGARGAAVENAFGRGRTLLIGTMAGWGYGAHAQATKHLAPRPTDLLAQLLSFAGKTPHIRCSDPRVKARLHQGDGGTHLWVANPSSQALRVELDVSSAWGPFSACRTHWGAQARVDRRRISLTCEPRDITALALE